MKRIGIGSYEFKQSHLDAVEKSLKETWLTAGPYIDEFEDRIAKYHRKEYGVFVNSGQSALEVALRIAQNKIGKDKLKVVIPSTTYLATLWAVLNTDNIPLFADIDSHLVIDPESVLKHKEFDVLMPVDLCGYSAHQQTQEVIRGADHDFIVINDACEALGSQTVHYGDITCFSFYTSHMITTGYGGMLCSCDKDDIEFARSYISHGRQFGGDFTKYQGQWVDRFKFDKVGVSYRESSLSASLGLAQIDGLYKNIAKRQAVARIFAYKIGDEGVFNTPSHSYILNCVFQFFPVICSSEIDREHFLSYLYDNGIDSRVLLSLTNQSIVKEKWPNLEEDCIQSKIINERGFLIPCHDELSPEEVKYIVETFNSYKGK